MIPFSSERMSMGAVIKLPQGGYRAYFRGVSDVSEVLATKSTSHIVIHKDGQYLDGSAHRRAQSGEH